MQGLVEILQRDEQASVSDLASVLAVTEMTIRRDLEVLERDGVLERFHGGARLLASSSYEPPLMLRERIHAEEKRALARAISEVIADGDALVLDGGTTGIAIARALAGRRLTVCPLSLRVAWEFEQSNTVTLRMPPGVARAGELSLSGPDTIDYLGRHHFDHFVMTASGFSVQAGFTEWNSDDAAVKRAALAGARRTTAAVDRSKWGRTAFATICDLDEPTTVLVAGLADGTEQDALRQAIPSLTEVGRG
ncbi:DeoR/GlpR family DNA-binding transcription regulator [Rathayibacter sp. SD072]|uniref:DeoR/GlpR family DNA-binding transcription regulator n=1 Tax=Rathayibacter sp. SD072 TaxID=2781731 RepID=UPI001A973038|nr:DeoR/GlpR family DNA-binding transcription regulator [Rathayibacter sp. SD072]MBO0982668.1 DeoR/GlpR transcriptional regulator [Rathayibacter sp. SD072]